MKNNIYIILLATAAACLFPQQTPAQAPQENRRFILFGYKPVRLAHPGFSHDTHPDDSFLPDSNVPGSAGATELGDPVHFLTIGFGYQPRLSDSVSLNFDAGFLLGANRDRRQNANDARPAGEGSFIYSQARFGMFAAAGASYHIKKFWIGVEAQLASVLVEAGWDRHNSDKSQSMKIQHRVSVGPKVGYRCMDRFGGMSALSIEGTVQFSQSAMPGVQVILNF